uniref:cytochrome P450 2U1-like n=1 Tax=Ciona intestinalis TaxID=7719 RepID=UPI000180D046|nr:cytochrome P450 2U1-like [Ciona intestinalis]|eukprot:XP_002122620.1 cytochrome P450 2U1-like [Ciona intestinalis]
MEEYGIINSIKVAVDTVILVGLAIYLTWHFWNKRTPGGAPGPRGLPFIGAITSIRKHPEHAMMKWNQQYGPVCMVRLGFKDILLLGSYEAAHEALVKSPDFANRPPAHSIEVIAGGKGIVMIPFGPFHQEQRRFGLNALREHGMGRRALEPTVHLCAQELCERIEEYGSKPFNLDNEVYQSVSSIISRLVFGHDVVQENLEFRKMIFQMIEPNKLNILAGILAFAPYLKHLPFFSEIHRKNKEFRLKMESSIRKEIEEHMETRDRKEPRDYIDSFLNEMEKSNQVPKAEAMTPTDEDEPNTKNEEWKQYSSFTQNQLIAMVRDLFMAGTDTTSSTTCWIILFLCRYPEVQRKMQEEVDQVLGSNGVPKMALAEKMPYTRAVIQEIARMRPTLPLSVPHCTTQDTMMMGYKIPKDTIVLTNIWGIHHDEKLWKNPYDFNPERHLDSNGNFVKSSNIMQFNIGLRSCLGQQLAKMELFLLTTSLCRHFSFSVVGEVDMEGESMVTLRPCSMEVVATKRA